MQSSLVVYLYHQRFTATALQQKHEKPRPASSDQVLTYASDITILAHSIFSCSVMSNRSRMSHSHLTCCRAEQDWPLVAYTSHHCQRGLKLHNCGPSSQPVVCTTTEMGERPCMMEGGDRCIQTARLTASLLCCSTGEVELRNGIFACRMRKTCAL